MATSMERHWLGARATSAQSSRSAGRDRKRFLFLRQRSLFRPGPEQRWQHLWHHSRRRCQRPRHGFQDYAERDRNSFVFFPRGQQRPLLRSGPGQRRQLLRDDRGRRGQRHGMVFKITPSGTEAGLYSFAKTGTNGQTPYAGLIQGTDGNFYGTTYSAAPMASARSSRSRRAVPRRCCTPSPGAGDGEHPYAGVIQGSDGNFYGTTYQGGSGGYGTVFKLSPSGTETVLYTFAGGTVDGATPEAGVIQGSDGNFYGNTCKAARAGSAPYSSSHRAGAKLFCTPSLAAVTAQIPAQVCFRAAMAISTARPQPAAPAATARSSKSRCNNCGCVKSPRGARILVSWRARR